MIPRRQKATSKDISQTIVYSINPQPFVLGGTSHNFNYLRRPIHAISSINSHISHPNPWKYRQLVQGSLYPGSIIHTFSSVRDRGAIRNLYAHSRECFTML